MWHPPPTHLPIKPILHDFKKCLLDRKDLRMLEREDGNNMQIAVW